MFIGTRRKYLRVLAETPRAIRKHKQLRLVMTLLVKNEEDIIEENILFHQAMGVDGFIVTDNGSTDSTLSILRRYKDKGVVLELIQENGSGYEQKVWVDRMILMAKYKYQADWIINADADEFWYAPTLSLKDEFKDTRASVQICELVNVYPDESRPWQEWDETTRPVLQYEKYGLSPYSIFGFQRGKVAHRAAGYVQISMGNHKVRIFPKIQRKSNITIYHYVVRGREFFMRKMINGGEQLRLHRGKHGGRHWRYFYQLFEEGKLEGEYSRVIGMERLEDLKRDGHLVKDNVLPALFKELGIYNK